ncbi:hypothetical protein HDU96_006468 [Phlyctochytrium bullatum]|nr:hypothetical protein HDU96_006468 [Phlyctochytrium bullatum]
MYTTTSKTILSPLAEAVTALILIISESEIKKSPMPDLTALARIVDDQVRNLVGIGKRIAEKQGSDEVLKKEMPAACDEVLKASDLLLTSTSQLVRDPYSSPGRSQLLEAVRGILRGTTHVLSAFDDAEVRRIVAQSRTVRANIAKVDVNNVATATGPEAEAAGITLTEDDAALATKQSLTPTERHRLETLERQRQNNLHRYAIAVAILGQSVLVLGQLAHKRLGELQQPLIQTRLKDAIQALVRESPLVMSACRVALANPGVQEAKTIRAVSCAKLSLVAKEIEELVLMSDENEQAMTLPEHSSGADIGKHRKKVEESSAAIRSAVAAHSEPLLRVALADLKHATNAILQDTKRAGETIKSPEVKAELQSISDAIVNLESKVSETAGTSLAHPESQRHAQELLSLLELNQEKHQALANTRSRAVVGELTALSSNLSDRRLPGTPYNNFMDAVSKRNKPRFATATQDLDAQANRMLALAGLAQDQLVAAAVVSGCGPQQIATASREVGEIKKRLSGLLPALVAAGHMAICHPDDKPTALHLEEVSNAWQTGLKEMQNGLLCQEGTFKVADLLGGTKSSLEKHVVALDAAASHNDTDKVRREGNDIVSCANQLIAIARREIESSEDQGYKSNLEVKIKEAEKVIPYLVGKTKAIFESQKLSPGDLSSLQTHINELTQKFGALGELIRGHRGISLDDSKDRPTELPASPELAIQGISVQLLENALSDVVFVDEEPPRPLNEAEAKANPIQAAAQELKVEASHWSAKDNAIITAAQKMSDRLADLGTYHIQIRKECTPEAKRSFISAAQQIMSEGNAIVLACRPIADHCTDRRLRIALVGDLDRIDTLAQQLKIVAAVKAAAPGDTDRDSQLVACAQNLMQSVRSCLNHAEAGSIRVAKSGEKVNHGPKGTSNNIRFRRNVYRSKGLAAAR